MQATATYSIEQKLDVLHRDSQHDLRRIAKEKITSLFRPLTPADFKHVYLPISKKQGKVIKNLIVEHNCKHVVEFGTSFGISTLYLADAVKETGGSVISTELIASKADVAQQHIKEVGLDAYVDIRVGDAMETLKGHDKPIDFLFLDGWKDLYLPLLKMLEPQLHSGTLIYADNTDMSDTQAYINYIQQHSDKYPSQFIHDRKAMLTIVR